MAAIVPFRPPAGQNGHAAAPGDPWAADPTPARQTGQQMGQAFPGGPWEAPQPVVSSPYPAPTPEQLAAARAERIQNAADDAEIQMRARELAQRRIRGEIRPPAMPGTRGGVLFAEPMIPTRYAIDGLWQEDGNLMITAPGKAGKTTLETNLIRVLVDGGKFLDRFEVHKSNRTVTILDFEMIREQLTYWLRKQQIQNADGFVLHSLKGKTSSFDIMDDSCRAEWVEILRAQDTGTLVVDCLRPILDALGLSEDKDAGRFLVKLDALKVEAGIDRVALIHHAGHTGERARGDSRLRDWPDAEWRLMLEKPENPNEEPDPDGPRFFSAKGRDVSVSESRLLFDPRTLHLSLEGGNRADEKKDRKRRSKLCDVIRALRESEQSEQEEMTATQIYEAVGGNKQECTGAIEKGVDDGLIAQRKVGKAKFHKLSERGIQWQE